MAAWSLRLVIPVPGQPPWVHFGLGDLDLTIADAETEDDARKQADEYDHRDLSQRTPGVVIEHPWLNKKYSVANRLSK